MASHRIAKRPVETLVLRFLTGSGVQIVLSTSTGCFMEESPDALACSQSLASRHSPGFGLKLGGELLRLPLSSCLADTQSTAATKWKRPFKHFTIFDSYIQRVKVFTLSSTSLKSALAPLLESPRCETPSSRARRDCIGILRAADWTCYHF